MQPLLTIAIPTYNRKKYLGIAINSILSQWDERLEILVSDNCSTDGTEEFVRENYPSIRYERNSENVGGDANFLSCYRKATGKFVLLLGSDDVITEGAITKILNFLTIHPDLNLLFMNHVFFSGDYPGLKKCSKIFVKQKIESFVTSDKNKFMNVAKNQLTFISCVGLSKHSFDMIENPEQYLGTYFPQTYIAFQATKDKKAQLGYLSYPCIADNGTEGRKQTDTKFIYEVFGPKMQDVYIRMSEQCGYNKKQMQKIHSDFLASSWPIMIMAFKAKKIFSWKKDFWHYGYPIIKDYPKAWIAIMPAVYLPDCFAVWIRNAKRKLIKKA